MTQAMILIGVLAICAVSGVLLRHRAGRTSGPDEPTGSYTAPTPPVPLLPPATGVAGSPPVAPETPRRPSQALPPALSVALPLPLAPPASPALPVARPASLPLPVALPASLPLPVALPASPAPSAASPVRRRNNGFVRFDPAPVRARRA